MTRPLKFYSHVYVMGAKKFHFKNVYFKSSNLFLSILILKELGNTFKLKNMYVYTIMYVMKNTVIL